MNFKKISRLAATASLSAVFLGSSACSLIPGSALRVSSSQENGDVDVTTLIKTVDDLKQRTALGMPVSESEVIASFGQAKAQLALRGKKIPYDELFDIVNRGAEPENVEASEAFRRNVADVNGYVFECRNLVSRGQMHYTTELQTERTGFDYSVQVIFKGGNLIMINDSGRPDVIKKDSELPFKYLLDAAVKGGKALGGAF